MGISAAYCPTYGVLHSSSGHDHDCQPQSSSQPRTPPHPPTPPSPQGALTASARHDGQACPSPPTDPTVCPGPTTRAAHAQRAAQVAPTALGVTLPQQPLWPHQPRRRLPTAAALATPPQHPPLQPSPTPPSHIHPNPPGLDEIHPHKGIWADVRNAPICSQRLPWHSQPVIDPPPRPSLQPLHPLRDLCPLQLKQPSPSIPPHLSRFLPQPVCTRLVTL